jgi:AraC-like DNA-binding protein/ligand-binding sensor domain-containing protein/CheY-like chemotaxis protein
MKSSKLAAVLGFALLSVCAFGTRTKTISSQEGISNNAICAIHQDALGHLYIGTMDGLNIWDGHTLKNFVAKDGKNYFSGNQIRHIVPGMDGHLYMQTNYGTACLDMITREVKFYDEIAFSTAITVTEEGNIFSISDSKKFQYLDTASSELTTFSDITFDEEESIKHIALLEDGRLCIFSRKDTYLITFSDEHSPSIRKVENTGLECLFATARYEGYHLVISADGKLYKVDGRDGKAEMVSEMESNLLRTDQITGIIADEKGCLISFMQNGVMRHTYGKKKLEKTEIHCGVFSMIPDRYQPIVWIGTDCNGLIRWSDKATDINCITFDNLPYSIEMPIRSICLDRKGHLWIGTKGDGLYRIRDFSPKGTFDQKNTDRFTTDNSAIRNNAVFAIKESKEDFLWIGGEGYGLYCYSYQTGSVEPVKGSEGFLKVHDLLETDGSTLWVATDGQGCYRCRFKTVDGVPIITEIEELDFVKPFGHRASVFSMALENDSTIWFASRGNGVLSYDMKTGQSRVVQFPTDNGLAINETFFAAKTKDMLFATGNGMVAYSTATDSIRIPEYVPKKAIHAILPDGNGNIWITTNSGIISLDENFLYRSSFNRFSGIDVLEYSDGACYRDPKSGTLFFGGINGFTVIDEDSSLDDSKTSYTPDIHITNFIQNNEYSHISLKMKKGKLRIPYSKSIFAIEFSLVDNLNYPDYRFFYNIDGNWTENNSNIIYLPSLDPGNYTLKIKYLNQATRFESEEYGLDIYIIPPIYRRWWAFVIYFLMAAAMIYQIVRYLQNKYISMKERLEERYEKEIRKVKSDTTGTITEELSVQITFMLGLCQQIRQQTVNNPNVAGKVVLVEYNIARINKILQILNDYKGISETSPGEVALIHVSQIANELLDIMKSNTKNREVTMLHEIEKDIIISVNKEAFLTLFNTLIYKFISIASGKKEVYLGLRRGDKGGIVMHTTVTMDEAQYEETAGMLERYESQPLIDVKSKDESIRNFELILCSKLVKEMKGRITHDYDKAAGILKMDIEIPQQNIGENHLRYEDSSLSENINTLNTLVENQFPVKMRTDHHLEKICLVSSNKEISSFLNYFMSEKYNVLEYSGTEAALSDMLNQMPVAVMYDVTSMMNGFAGFMEKMKENKRTGQIPVIALTSSLQITEKEECMKQGADLCITFPFNMDYLHAALEKMLNKRESMAEYYKSPISTYVMNEGKIIHRDDKEFMNGIFRIIDENLSNPELSATMIAEKIGLSPRVMYRKLADITDKTLHQMIKESRMEMATKLLYSSKLTIDEIMYRVGYDNRSTFYRNFKEAKGMTPKEYRDGIKDNVLKSLT